MLPFLSNVVNFYRVQFISPTHPFDFLCFISLWLNFSPLWSPLSSPAETACESSEPDAPRPLPAAPGIADPAVPSLEVGPGFLPQHSYNRAA